MVHGCLQMLLNVFEVDTNWKIVNKVSENTYKVGVGLSLLKISFCVVAMCNNAITVRPSFDPFQLISRDKRWLRRWVRQDGMNDGKEANSTKQFAAIIVGDLLDLRPGTRCFLLCSSALQHKCAQTCANMSARHV